MASGLTFGRWLLEERTARDLTQRSLAKLTGGEITASQIHRLETGTRLPGLATLRGLAGAFNVEFRIDANGRLWADKTGLEL